MESIAHIALGANLGRREESVLRAARLLGRDGSVRLLRLSSLYESAAVGIPDAPPFINAVAQVATLVQPLDLLERLQAVEAEMGRRGGHWRSREIDLDLIAFGSCVLADSRLTLPHPRYHERAFVLIPLREVSPGFVCPRTHLGVDALVDALASDHRVVRVSGRSPVATG